MSLNADNPTNRALKKLSASIKGKEDALFTFEESRAIQNLIDNLIGINEACRAAQEPEDGQQEGPGGADQPAYLPPLPGHSIPLSGGAQAARQWQYFEIPEIGPEYFCPN